MIEIFWRLFQGDLFSQELYVPLWMFITDWAVTILALVAIAVYLNLRWRAIKSNLKIWKDVLCDLALITGRAIRCVHCDAVTPLEILNAKFDSCGACKKPFVFENATVDANLANAIVEIVKDKK